MHRYATRRWGSAKALVVIADCAGVIVARGKFFLACRQPFEGSARFEFARATVAEQPATFPAARHPCRALWRLRLFDVFDAFFLFDVCALFLNRNRLVLAFTLAFSCARTP